MSSAPSKPFLVTEMTVTDIGPDLRMMIDGSSVEIDGVTASADPFPGSEGNPAIMLVTFTDVTGRNRVAEVTLTASWVEDYCWHLSTVLGVGGQECRDCGLPLTHAPKSQP